MMTNKGVKLPAPGSPEAPKYWAYEVGGELAPAIGRLLNGAALSEHDITLIREYCRQWIASPVWDLAPKADATHAATLAMLRASVDGLVSAGRIRMWIRCAEDEGIDPL